MGVVGVVTVGGVSGCNQCGTLEDSDRRLKVEWKILILWNNPHRIIMRTAVSSAVGHRPDSHFFGRYHHHA